VEPGGEKKRRNMQQVADKGEKKEGHQERNLRSPTRGGGGHGNLTAARTKQRDGRQTKGKRVPPQRRVNSPGEVPLESVLRVTTRREGKASLKTGESTKPLYGTTNNEKGI